jgi:hypothetical protein
MLAFERIISDTSSSGWQEKMEKTSANSKILRNHEFSKVTAGIVSKEYTLIPEALFRSGDETLYFRKNFTFSPAKIIRSQPVSTAHLYTVFGIDSELEKDIEHLFQDPQVFHHSQALITDSLIHASPSNAKQIRVIVHSDIIDILVHQNKKLHLLNSFTYQTPEDILYYTLFVCEQLEINPAESELKIGGRVQNNSALTHLLGNYFSEITVWKKPSGLSLRFNGSDVPYHEFSVLYNLTLCV